jgi:hypothetical protein
LGSLCRRDSRFGEQLFRTHWIVAQPSSRAGQTIGGEQAIAHLNVGKPFGRISVVGTGQPGETLERAVGRHVTSRGQLAHAGDVVDDVALVDRHRQRLAYADIRQRVF